LVPGILGGKGVSWRHLSTFLYLSTGGILGLVSHVVFTIVLGFIFFGQVALHTGGGQIITELAMAGMGRFRGGPAKVAVVASSMFGTISGSPVANVLTTGTLTIPMMIRTGYQPKVAGAIEAVASTGGIILPPVMGAAAFIIAEFLGISYPEVALAAVIPGILYYLSVFIQVDLEAAKTRLKGLPAQQLPSLKKALSKGWVFIIPVAILIYSLFILYLAPAKAAVYSAAAFFVVSAFRKDTRLTPGKLSALLEGTGRLTMEIAVIVIIAGIAIAVIGITGAGVTFSRALVQLSGGNVFVLLLLAAVSSTILGMGMNATATYIIVAILTAPALIQLGVEPLAAHLFVFYFGSLAMITPPVCVAVYPASVLAGSPVMRTGIEAVKIGIAAFIVPFVFALDPALLFMGSPTEILIAASKAVIGFAFLGVAIRGYLFSEIALLNRSLLVIGALGLLVPHMFIVNMAGLGLIIAIILWEWMARRASRREQGSPLA
jgi:TRAP transporter 4TM/12TM fusion protein